MSPLIQQIGRKFAWGTLALLCITLLAALGHDIGFEVCFDGLVFALIAGNYGEHREKRKAKETDAPPPTA